MQWLGLGEKEIRRNEGEKRYIKEMKKEMWKQKKKEIQKNFNSFSLKISCQLMFNDQNIEFNKFYWLNKNKISS